MFGFDNFSWGDLWGGLGSLGNVASLFRNPQGGWGWSDGGNSGYSGGQPQGQPTQPPQMGGVDMSGFGEMMGMWQEQLAAQQEAMQQEQKKSLARQASGMRKSMQGSGITWDPENPELGAGGVGAIASQMGISPDELLAALKQYGGEFGFEGFGQGQA